ncbi:MAG: ferritin-like domain-containing protein [Myxococcota bacterium]
MLISHTLDALLANAGTLAEAGRSKNLSVLQNLLGPAFRGLVLRRGKLGAHAAVEAHHRADFDLSYLRDRPELSRLYEAAKNSQWIPDQVLDFKTAVDPYDPALPLIDETLLPLYAIPAYHQLPERTKRHQQKEMLAWLLSQFLHGEQGALFAACQVTESVGDLDSKLYGSTQVVDEGRHVEVFHRYLTTKLEKLYAINDNLYVIVDAIMGESRWDLKFLGMQILIEGLALGAFGTMRSATEEPLLKNLLKYVITDEARHVHFGVLALAGYYQEALEEKARREREDWAFEVSLLMRNRFLAHEFYEEHWAHKMKRREWDQLILGSAFMERFRTTMFRRIVPNLRRIGLMTPRIQPYYRELGLIGYMNDRAAPELTAEDLLS